VRIDHVQPELERVTEITRICNESLVYEFLWKDILGGNPYPPEKATGFIKWGGDGWKKGSHFVFLVLTESGEVAAALDIKSANTESSEIGYWASQSHPAIISTAVEAMCGLASAASYKGLFGRVRPDNTGSKKVLIRCGFLPSGVDPEKGCEIYRRCL
jgi:RimJ/RimL family protein N-acetyltransferase